MHSTTIYQTLRTLGLAGLLVIFFCSGLFWFYSASGINPAQYFLLATGLWIFGWWQTWQRAGLNRPDKNSPPFPNLGWANSLTLLRGGLIALTGGFLLQPLDTGVIAWLPGLFYGIAALLDRADGFVARRSGRTSLLGSELDTLFDALGLLIAPLLAIQLGKLHWSFFAVSLAYYVFVFGLYWRQKKQRPTYPLLPSQLRRAFAGFQMGFVALVLLPILPTDATRLLGVAFMLPILIGFMVDWLVVSGRIDGSQAKTQTLFIRLDATSKCLLQPALRIVIAALIFLFIHLEKSLSITSVAALVLLAGIILTGAGARIAALLLLILCSYLLDTYSGWHSPTLLFASSWLLLLGPGNYSLWRGDDRWVNRQDGI